MWPDCGKGMGLVCEQESQAPCPAMRPDIHTQQRHVVEGPGGALLGNRHTHLNTRSMDRAKETRSYAEVKKLPDSGFSPSCTRPCEMCAGVCVGVHP